MDEITNTQKRSKNKFSPRMQEILGLIARPCSRKQIREKLQITSATLNVHIMRIKDKTGIDEYVDLIVYAQEHGFGSVNTGE